MHGGAIDLGDQAACADQCGAVEANALAEQAQFVRRLPRLLATTAADVDSELIRQRPQAPLEGANDAGGDAGRMPIHAHHGAEGLEPEWMRKPL